MEYYTAIKKNRLLIHTTRMNLADSMLNKSSQTQNKSTYCVYLLEVL